MGDGDSNPYNYNDTVGDAFTVPSTLEHEAVRLSDRLPGPAFNQAPDCAYGGFGTGGETIEKDGSVTTRWKGPGGIYGDGVVDGGTP